ncbi:hypothetical protein JM80_2298 [Cellulophaga sp. RHA_52]|nr:hypothetical protein JM80_2298 [Cellulophaga sp. RHA_52]
MMLRVTLKIYRVIDFIFKYKTKCNAYKRLSFLADSFLILILSLNIKLVE